MKRESYLISKNIAGSYNLSILKNPTGSWHYSSAGTFDTEEKAINHYYKLKEEERMVSRMHMNLLIKIKNRNMNKQSKYVVRKAIDYGCKVYNVVNTETGNRINYCADYESAKEFAERQNNAAKKVKESIT